MAAASAGSLQHGGLNAANLALGWRRLVSNNEVVYISPSGISLRTHDQIKSYLLSAGTCKCGLPCPLRPEYFFDFNSQVPNSLLQIPLENGITSRSTLMCLHQRKFIENQQNFLQKDVKRRKFSDMSVSGKIITSPMSQCNSVAIYSGNVMQTSQIVGNSGRMQMMAPQLINPNQQGISNASFHSFQLSKQQHAVDQDSLQDKAEGDKQIGSVTLSKTPPWRKNSLLHNSQQVSQNQVAVLPHQAQQYSSNNERVPPLPQAHMCQSSSQALPAPLWQHEQSQNRLVKNRSSLVSKKKPNFKDDPTGYMDHQTAILHNSIMNVVQNPDLNDTGYESVDSEIAIRNNAPKSIPSQVKTEQISVMQQNQNAYQSSSTIEIKTEHMKAESELATKSYESMLAYETAQKNAAQRTSIPLQNFIYNQNSRVLPLNPSELNIKHHHQLQSVPPHPVIANVPSSQQIMVEKNSTLVRNQYICEDQQHKRSGNITQATTTTIGGQTVTNFPNGMVKVEQNCDSMAALKPQQHIQLQQQIQQQNILFRQNQQMQKSMRKNPIEYQYMQNITDQKGSVMGHIVQESSLPSSTTLNRCTPERRNTPDCKGPPQVGAISTSDQSPLPCPSPAESPESSTSVKISSSYLPTSAVQQKTHQSIFANSQTSARNTITSVTAGKAITATTSINDRIPTNFVDGGHEAHPQAQKLQTNSIIPASGLQMQPIVRDSGNHIIMTSTGQLIVVPNQSGKGPNQVIINNPSGSNIVMNSQSNVLINQPSSIVNNSQLIGNSVEVLNNQANPSNIIQNSGNGLVIQNPNLVQGGQNLIQSPNNLIPSNGSNFIVNSAGNMQPLILNNSNLIQQNGQNLLATNSTIMAAGNASKVLNNQNILGTQSNVINNQVLSNSTNVISANSGGIIGQQAVVLNTLPNGYMIQPNYATATVDGSQVVGQIVNQDTGGSYLHSHHQRQIILASPDSKRKAKKRKSSASSSPSTPSSLSPQQSPTASSMAAQSGNPPQGTMVQIAPQYPPQGFQISPGIQGIVVNKSAQNTQPQQQILFQNGQIIQPINLIGQQQLLVPAGLVVTPETTLLQIQNMGPCGGLITPQGMVIRAPSPQNKSFLSPNTSGQQFIVGGGSQVSPLGQIYGGPVSLVVPQSNSGAAAFVQQNTTIVQQQSPMLSSNSNSDATAESSLQSRTAASPPDTTTHSPRSPERPPSLKSGGSEMVQCVSSSEPDSVVSPAIADSAQSPTTTDFDRSGNAPYQGSIYKPSDVKLRKVETPIQYSHSSTLETTSLLMKPDSHDSPTNSPPVSATSTTSSLPTSGNSITGSGTGCGGQLPSFSIGELVWGAARGHPAWPGKILNPPEGICTPSDSTWVQWFGGRPNVELVAINSLKSLSEGLEAHHKAQKDTRKSRKLNSQLERAIQEAMAELDRISQNQTTTSVLSKNRSRGRQQISLGHQRAKPVKIAPAPPCANNIQQIRQQTSITQVTHHQQTMQQQTSPGQTK